MVECLPGMHRALGFILSAGGKQHGSHNQQVVAAVTSAGQKSICRHGTASSVPLHVSEKPLWHLVLSGIGN